MEFEKILRAVGLENRLDILHMLMNGAATVSEVKANLKKNGVSKPNITVSRYLENLKDVGLLSKMGGKFHLSIVGRLLLIYFDEAEEKLDAISKFGGHLKHPIDYLPEEFVKRMDVLQHARVLSDQYAIVTETFKGLERAEESVSILVGNTISQEYTIASFKKILGGIKERVITDAGVVDQDTEVYRDTTKKLKLKDEEIRKLKANHSLRAYGNLTLRIMVVDDKMAGISLPESGRQDLIVPSFQSENKEFIAWVRDIFEWHWQKAEPVVW